MLGVVGFDENFLHATMTDDRVTAVDALFSSE